jgi:hypothetical protein
VVAETAWITSVRVRESAAGHGGPAEAEKTFIMKRNNRMSAKTFAIMKMAAARPSHGRRAAAA